LPALRTRALHRCVVALASDAWCAEEHGRRRGRRSRLNVESVGSPGLWAGFTAFVLVMLALDLGVFHRKAHEVRIREALGWTAFWISLALLFNAAVYVWFGSQRALEFLTGYLIEKALSVDNIFVFLVIFSAFSVPAKLQHRALFWGILGALVMRAIFILLGAALLQRFHWISYLFGAFLVFTGIKLMLQRGTEVDPRRNPLFRLFRRAVPSIDEYRDGHFTVVEGGKRYATPLLLVLVAIEATDIIFAVDSIPAIFAVTADPFIVYTSNIFAILGLRALYFALAGIMEKFTYLKVGLSLVLLFVGMKMLVAGVFKIPIAVSLGVIALLLGGSIVASVLRSARKSREDHALPPGSAAKPS
jgi:tellurite resistance protein TerC